jgi:hypothetical protein
LFRLPEAARRVRGRHSRAPRIGAPSRGDGSLEGLTRPLRLPVARRRS